MIIDLFPVEIVNLIGKYLTIIEIDILANGNNVIKNELLYFHKNAHIYKFDYGYDDDYTYYINWIGKYVNISSFFRGTSVIVKNNSIINNYTINLNIEKNADIIDNEKYFLEFDTDENVNINNDEAVFRFDEYTIRSCDIESLLQQIHDNTQLNLDEVIEYILERYNYSISQSEILNIIGENIPKKLDTIITSSTKIYYDRIGNDLFIIINNFDDIIRDIKNFEYYAKNNNIKFHWV
jgi:hypothetical protein